MDEHSFPLREKQTLEFGLDIINVFNNPGSGIPSASVLGSPAPAGGLASRFLNKDYTDSGIRSMIARLKITF